ncbi:hypothetical protein [Arthrobacter glacialis]|uniref:hypothetical protein n=1 Tax=Arthrobacter glacialis TaxID=1664 RepID=UPI000CD3DBCF|nr:hypothetical protein [Arthrobacter glacialis]POH60685.1 hypothetical protein CVS28_03180 [Arthrobacter glacialis]
MKKPQTAFVAVVVLVAGLALSLPSIGVTNECNVLFGVAAAPLNPEQTPAEALREFEADAGRKMEIVHYYELGQDKLFPSPAEFDMATRPGEPLIPFHNWRPDGLTWREVADGAADAYLYRLAQHLGEAYSQPYFLSLNAEFERFVDPAPGSGQTAADFRDFFSHVVRVIRSNPHHQAVIVLNYSGTAKWASMPWFEDLHPGGDVVDWIAQDTYMFDPAATPGMAQLVNQPSGSWPGFYAWAAMKYPDTPQMIAEWGVENSALTAPYVEDFYASAAKDLAKFPKLRALVYWNRSGLHDGGRDWAIDDTAINANSEVNAAFRKFANNGLFFSSPTCRDKLRGGL